MDHESFEVIVVDQNVDRTTERALEQFKTDQRFLYHRSPTRGSGVARNVAADLATGEYLAYTDDDCTVPTDWLRTVEKIFAASPRIGLVFCNVVAGEYDPAAGFVPTYVRDGDLLVTNMLTRCRARGIGAGMTVRKKTLTDVGKFDPLLGPGSRFPGFVDGDMTLRVLLNGWHVYETDRAAVTHFGFRSWNEGRKLAEDRWVGIGAAFAKPLKRGRLSVLAPLGCELFIAVRKPVAALIGLRRPQGAREAWYLLLGLGRGLRTPIDKRTLTFKDA
jgi:glycosyltransferase involved in cell wall biosynthesis